MGIPIPKWRPNSLPGIGSAVYTSTGNAGNGIEAAMVVDPLVTHRIAASIPSTNDET
jgi:hypothetical protein